MSHTKAARERENARRKERVKNDPDYAARRRAIRQNSALRTVPKGHRLKGVSKLVNAAGEMTGEWQKSQLRPVDPPTFPIEPPGFLKTSQSTMLDSTGAATVQWVRFEKDKAQAWDEMTKAAREFADEYRGEAMPVLSYEIGEANLINVIPIGDPHIGMLAWGKETGEDFDSKIARDDLTRTIRMLVDRAPPAKTLLLAQLGDFFHAEDDKQVTPTAGHKLDVDTRAGRITKLGFHLMRALVDIGLTKHERVVVLNLRGNHDPYKSIALNLWLQAVYETEPRVTILDNNNPFIFYEHGANLFGFHHGDGAKPEALPGIMACWEDGAPWGRTQHRRWFTGHIHSFKGREFPGVVWESYNTLAPGDFWSHWKGYRSAQLLHCMTFDAEDGQVSKQTVSIQMSRKQRDKETK